MDLNHRPPGQSSAFLATVTHWPVGLRSVLAGDFRIFCWCPTALRPDFNTLRPEPWFLPGVNECNRDVKIVVRLCGTAEWDPAGECWRLRAGEGAMRIPGVSVFCPAASLLV